MNSGRPIVKRSSGFVVAIVPERGVSSRLVAAEPRPCSGSVAGTARALAGREVDMTYPAPDYRPRWDDSVPTRGIPWYVVVLGIAAIAVLVLTAVGFWIAGSVAPAPPP
jgi:hypothetical protein